MTKTTETKVPRWMSDDYRNDKCATCGNQIGYGRFTAVRSFKTSKIVFTCEACR